MVISPPSTKEQNDIYLTSRGADVIDSKRQETLDKRYYSLIKTLDKNLELNPFLKRVKLKVETLKWAEYLCARLNDEGIHTMISISGIIFSDYYLLMILP
jgi:hypothetical protein